MKLILENMDDQTFKVFYKESIIEYAEEHVKSGDWEEEGSIIRARTEFENLLPDGLNTSNQYLLSVIYNNLNIGYLWLHIFDVKEQKKCFIYDIKIKDTYRGQGFGTKTMECLEEYCKNKEVASIGLHVFGHNKRAVSLYNKMCFEITNYRMEKKLK
ncbi:GNAT family N-acetyltransferase [Staphylococcus equorum]|uniref:GNAT family N-acetyltransferase n=1 Tax=Staphylococcus equorum TaxID=246432 RepID=UPI001F415A24|nr:GNAT family N-acetyltransferase [Staphylococcus equorum]MCE5008022.1 GNAT family N-acetyltransferase [Staphylococcus equorum]